MKFNKIFVMVVDIVNCTDLYTPKDTIALRLLQKKIGNGLCMGGVYVNKIIRIVESSDIEIDKSRNDGRGLMRVKVEAECIIFMRGEVLADVTFIEISGKDKPTSKAVLKYEGKNIANVFVENTNNAQVYVAGKVGPVIVTGVEYTIGNNATIKAMAFVPITRKSTIYECKDINITPQESEIIRAKINGIKELLSGLTDDYAKYLKELLYPMIKKPEIELIQGSKRENLLELQVDKPLYVVRPIAVGYANTDVIVSDKASVLEKYVTDTRIVPSRWFVVLELMLSIIEQEVSSVANIHKAYPVKSVSEYKIFFNNFLRAKARN